MGLQIINSGLNTTVQDGGRLGFQDQGIPVSGFMDVTSAHISNLLLNNHANASLLELTLIGIKFKATKNITITITGANMQPTLNGEAISMYKAIKIPKNGIVAFKAAKQGVYTYVAFSGGLKIDNVLKSTSTYIPAKLGGFKGRALQKGDVLPITSKTLKTINAKVKSPKFLQKVTLECLKGPEWDWFTKESRAAFFNTSFKISKDCNRIGIRLEGNKIVLPERDEIISSGIVKGTVQITKAGNPIVMMADCPTTGGYLRLINLTSKACDVLSQVQIGGTVSFRLV